MYKQLPTHLQVAVKEAFRVEADAEQMFVLTTGDCFVNEQPARFAANQLPEGKRNTVKVMRTEVDTPPTDAKPKGRQDAAAPSGVAQPDTDKTSDDGAEPSGDASPGNTRGDGEGAASSEAELGGGAGGATGGAPTSAATYGKDAPKAAPKKEADKKPAAKKAAAKK